MDELYGLFKKNSANNHYVSAAKALNSAYATKHTAASMKILENFCSHGANMLIKDGVCYSSFIRNLSEYNDDEFSPSLELLLGIFSLQRGLSDDFDPQKDVKRVIIGKIGTVFLGEEATCCPKGNAMAFVGNDLYICFSFRCKNGRYKAFRAVYDTATGMLTKPALIKLKYGGNVYDLDDELINRIYKDNGFAYAGESILEMVSMWDEYNGEYYSTFVIGGAIPNNGILIKTRDFETAELISVIPYNEKGSAEAISRIFDGQLFVACRQQWTVPYMLLMRYDIDKGEWKPPYRIEDANSRPNMFIYKSELYLYNTVDEGFRKYSNISKIRTSKKAHNGKNNPVDSIATLYDCGAYNGFCVQNDRIFFVGSKDSSVCFGELKIKEYSPNYVQEKLLELFGEPESEKSSCSDSNDAIAIGAQRNS
jgi:hypothetical protein